jgi:hypothetical protein
VLWKLRKVAAMWDTIKGLLGRFGRPLLAKYLTRLVLWGTAAISAKLAVDAPAADTQSKLVDWLVAIAAALLAAGVDYLHHALDRKADGQ